MGVNGDSAVAPITAYWSDILTVKQNYKTMIRR